MTRQYRRPAALACALLALPLFTVGASAQIAVSANDNKAVLVNGVATVADNPAPDTVTIIDLSMKPPKVIAEVKAPTRDEIEHWKTHVPTIEEIDSDAELLAEFQRLAARGKGVGPSEEDF